MILGCSEQSVVNNTLRECTLSELRNNLRVLSAWEKVHAAEYLLWLGYAGGVRDAFLQEEARHGQQVPYRVGIWRVLAQCALDECERWK